jgi:L-ascorbate metabolism protein UlaG (beta-lactamase superfamily)
MGVPLTWLGHASFRLDSPGGKRIYIDPWLTGNPKCPEAEQQPERVDLIALTHGHGDHVGARSPLERVQPPVMRSSSCALARGPGRRIELPAEPEQGRTSTRRRKVTLTDAEPSSSAD